MIGEETIDNKNTNLSLRDLYYKLGEILQIRPDLESYPVMLCENMFSRGVIQPTIRHMTEEDINIEENMQLCCNHVFSQFDKGIILGFVSIIED